jgi:hypothetical protein
VLCGDRQDFASVNVNACADHMADHLRGHPDTWAQLVKVHRRAGDTPDPNLAFTSRLEQFFTVRVQRS